MILLRVLRRVFHLLYHQFAWSYDLVAAAVSAGLWQTWVRSVIPHLGDALRILEVGHGPGHLQSALQDAGRFPVGVDLSPQMGRIAQRRLARAGRPLKLVRADARRLPFAAGSFDALVATFPAEYIVEPAAWISFSRLLAPSGRIVVLVGALPGGRRPLELASRILFRLTGQAGQALDPALIRFRLEDVLGQAGLVGEYRLEQLESSATLLIVARRRDGGAV